LALADTGIGMAPDVAAKVFEPFFTTKEAGKGSGLGLSMVLRFRQAVGWPRHVRSIPGNGTTVRLYLPSERRGEHRNRGGEEGSVPPRGEETILIVEDDALVRRPLCDRSGGSVTRSSRRATVRRLWSSCACRAVHLLFTDMVHAGVG